MPAPSRRDVLGTVGTALAALAAGCPRPGSLGGAPDATDDPAPGTGPEPTATSTETAASTATEADPATAAQSATATDAETVEPSLGCGPGPRPAYAWPQRDRSATGDSYASDGPVFESKPAVSWSVDPTTPDEHSAYDPVFTQPVIAEGRLYVVKKLTFGPNQELPEHHVLHELDATTGDRGWSYELSSVPTSPAVDGDAVLVGAGNALYALDRSDGTERWTRAFPSPVETVVPGADRIYVVLDESVRALGTEGRTQWTVTFDETVTARPAVDDGRLYVGTLSGSLHAIAADGAREWTETTLREGFEDDDAPSVDRVLATECGVFAATDGDVYAFDSRGEFAWHAREAFRGLASDGDRVYGATGHGYVRGLDAATGERQWERYYGEGGGRVDGVYQSPVVTDGAVYAFARPDTLLALDPADGTERWAMADAVGDLAVDGDTLYGTRRDEGDVVAIRRR